MSPSDVIVDDVVNVFAPTLLLNVASPAQLIEPFTTKLSTVNVPVIFAPLDMSNPPLPVILPVTPNVLVNITASVAFNVVVSIPAVDLIRALELIPATVKFLLIVADPVTFNPSDVPFFKISFLKV